MTPKKQALAAIWLCACALAVSGQTKTDPAEVAFQAAVKAEMIDGDLRAAIAGYQKLAAGSNRAMAAKSLVRMGLCLEKMGDAQARAAYDKVVKDFADQKETVAAALVRLAALDRPEPGSPLVLRRVWAAPEANAEGAPTPDGRSFVFVDRKTGNLALRDLSTGATKTLTNNPDGLFRPGDRALISPDGKTVAYVRSAADDPPEIRLIRIDGTGDRALVQDEKFARAELGAWSRDGTTIAAALTMKDGPGGTENGRIALIALRDGSVRQLKALGPRRGEPRGFSPDGRLIVYAAPPVDAAVNRDIYLLGADGSGETALVQHPADDQLLGWTPDGKGILFTSDRSIPRGIWFLPVADGKPGGLPQMIRSATGDVEPLGFTRTGGFGFASESGRPSAYAAAIDPGTQGFSLPPTLVDPRAAASQYPMFSPEGRALSFLVPGPGDAWILRVRSLETGEEREFPVPPDVQVLRKPRWTADGRGVIVSGPDKEFHHVGFFLIDLRTKIANPLLSSNPQAETMGGEFSPDGKVIYLARTAAAFADRAVRIIRRDAVTAEEREIYSAPEGTEVTDLALSPDGLELTFSVRAPNGIRSADSLMIMPAGGGTASAVLRLEGRESIARDGLAWTPDGRSILFVKAVENSRSAAKLELWKISPGNAGAVRIGPLAEDAPSAEIPAGLRVHPDGSRIAFQAARRKPEVWMMEHYEPSPRPPAFLNAEYELTVEAWIWATAEGLAAGQQTVLSKGSFNYDGAAYTLMLTKSGMIRWGTRHGHDSFGGESGDWSIDGIVTDTAILPKTWYHVAGTLYAGRSASIYVNGSLVKTGPITQTILSRPSEPLTVASMFYYGAPAFPFQGLIDDLKIYDRALTPEEILQHFLAGLPLHKNPTAKMSFPR